MKVITILQYNCGTANRTKTRPFFDQAEPAKHHILAIQEPAWNKQTKRTYCPLGYTLVHRGNEQTKTCFMISTALGLETWKRTYSSDNLEAIELQAKDKKIAIFNAYNVT